MYAGLIGIHAVTELKTARLESENRRLKHELEMQRHDYSILNMRLVESMKQVSELRAELAKSQTRSLEFAAYAMRSQQAAAAYPPFIFDF
jgi:hypothetical protein